MRHAAGWPSRASRRIRSGRSTRPHARPWAVPCGTCPSLPAAEAPSACARLHAQARPATDRRHGRRRQAVRGGMRALWPPPRGRLTVPGRCQARCLDRRSLCPRSAGAGQTVNRGLPAVDISGGTMLRRLLILCALVLTLLGCSGGAACDNPSSAACTRVLFIGNSYTFVNDLPTMFATLASSGGHSVETGMVAEGGATFAEHATSADTAAKLASARWSIVVLQNRARSRRLRRSDRARCTRPLASSSA